MAPRNSSRKSSWTRRPRRQLGHPVLGQRALHQVVHVALVEADRAQPIGHPGLAHQLDQRAREHLAGVVRAGAADLGAQPGRRLQVALRIGRRGPAEHARRIQNHRHAVRDQRVVASDSWAGT